MRARARQLSMRRYRRPQWRIGCQHAKVAVTADAFVAWLALDPNRSRDEFLLVSNELYDAALALKKADA